MSKRQRSAGPYSLVTSRLVGPVIPIRSQLVTATSGTVVTEEVALNLQRDREVFDLMRVESYFDPTAYDSTVADGNCDIELGLYSNPQNPANLVTEANWQEDPELVYYDHATFNHELMTAVGTELRKTSSYKAFEFKEPFTVSRNFLWAIVMTQTTAFFTSAAVTLRGIVWGRRRIAAEGEFYDIMQRERRA